MTEVQFGLSVVIAIASVISLCIAVVMATARVTNSIHTTANETRKELKGDNQQIDITLRTELKATRDELKADNQQLGIDLRAELKATRDELKADIEGVRQASETAHTQINTKLDALMVAVAEMRG